MPGCAQANLPLDSFTCIQPLSVRLPVTGSAPLKDSITSLSSAIGSERRLPFTNIMQFWLFGDGEAVELVSWLEFLTAADDGEEELADEEA